MLFSRRPLPVTPLPRTEFLEAALWHGSQERAEALLRDHPGLRGADIHVAAVLGDADAVSAFLAADPASVHATAPPYGGTPLNYLCLSKYLRLHAGGDDAFLRTATALLDAGADPNTGFWTTGEFPERETALYGAAGVAHHAPLTRLLLERGADPNDEEVVYHSPEEYDLAAMQLVVETGRLTPASLALMLVRKCDWHDEAGVRYLLDHGADPNEGGGRGFVPAIHAVLRDNDLPIIELLLDHGADLTVADPRSGLTGVALAARRGRSDILAALERREIDLGLTGVDRLVAACARRDAAAVLAIVESEPHLLFALFDLGGRLLAEFAGNDNAGGVAHLNNLGMSPDAVFVQGDGYWGVAANSTALHVAAWRAAHDAARVLIDSGADVNARDALGRSPLMLAVKACVDSYWTEGRRPDTIEALLQAGASTDGVAVPTGYEEADRVLARHGLSPA